jgi:hypothetical protein
MAGERVTLELLCVGLSKVQGSKRLCPVFEHIVDGARSGTRMLWGKLRAQPGWRYTIEGEADGGTVFTSTLRTIGPWGTAEERLAMQETARATQIAHEAERLSHIDEIKSTLAPLRKLYQRLMPDQRRALLVNIITELTTHRREDDQ